MRAQSTTATMLSKSSGAWPSFFVWSQKSEMIYAMGMGSQMPDASMMM